MIYSLGIVLLLGFLIGYLFDRLKIPGIVGMIILGVLIGPSFLNIIHPDLISISAILRQIALVIILTRAGLSLDFKKLKKIGRPAFLLSFLPASFEIIGVLLFGPILLGISIIEALLLGSVLAAVSPAIIVPRMIKFMNKGVGKEKHMPELIMAGASIDDIYVIVLFYAFLGIINQNQLNVWSIVEIPISIILGIILGMIFAYMVRLIFKFVSMHVTTKILVILSSAFLMIGFEALVKNYIAVSALIGIMTMGMCVLIFEKDAKKIENGFQQLWRFFEILLFVLVGISIDFNYVVLSGFMPILLIVIVLVFRMIGVFVALIFTNLNYKERLFTAFSYIPKATVQASIGGIALSMNLPVGTLILTVAILSILITAPLGALLIDHTYIVLLDYNEAKNDKAITQDI